jgi:hypothetical protein
VAPLQVTPVGDLLVTIVGGVPGTRITANVTVFLSASFAGLNPADVPQLSGNSVSIAGVRSTNTCVFAGVPIDEPGSAGSLKFKISNMKVDASPLAGGAGAPAQINAVLSITSIPLNNPTQVVAVVRPG